MAYKNRDLTYEESWAAYNACLNDLKSRFVVLLNDLQRQYEDVSRIEIRIDYGESKIIISKLFFYLSLQQSPNHCNGF